MLPMSRVERIDNPSDRRAAESPRQADRGRTSTPAPQPTPGKAEGEQEDVEQALRNQRE
jgi:hypothetical protein